MDLEIFKNINNHKKLIINIVIAIIVATVVIIVGVILWNYLIFQKVVTLNPTAGTTIAIGSQVGEGTDIGTLLTKTSTKQILRLEPGHYVVQYSGTKDYQDQSIVINIVETTELTTPKLKLTQNKLDALLAIEKPAAQNAFSLVFDVDGYNITDDKLYQQGDWYSARLVPNNSSLDTLRVIMKKENGQWKVAAGPSIIFFIGDYPNIPQNVISVTNKFGFN